MTTGVAQSVFPIESDSGIDVCVSSGLEGLRGLRAAWEAIASNIDSQAFYHQYEWYETYLKYLVPEPRNTWFISLFRGAEPVAIIPLTYKPSSRRGELNRFELPCHDHLPMADALVRRGEDRGALLKCVLAKLRQPPCPKWDILLASAVADDSGFGHAFATVAGEWVVREYAHGSDSIPNAGGYAPTSNRLSGSFRRDLRRKQKLAATEGRLDYRSVESPDSIEEAFSEFLRVEASGWKGVNGTRTAVACNPHLENFYRGLVRVNSRFMHCVVNLLYLDNICIAAEFCLFCNGALNLLKIGYLESYPRISPGDLLFDHVLRDWCERPGTRAISLVGDAAWQHKWHPDSVPLYRYRLYNRTVRAFPAWLWRTMRPYVLKAVKATSNAGRKAGARIAHGYPRAGQPEVKS